MADGYFSAVKGQLDCPVSVYGGDSDDDVPVEQLPTWQAHFTATLNIEIFEGGHYFIEDNYQQVLEKLNPLLSSLCGNTP